MAMLKSILLVFIFFSFIKKFQLSWSVDSSSLECLENERNALFDFKQNLIDQTDRLSSWAGQDCCKWVGVTCDNFTGHVVELDLRNPFPFDLDRFWDSSPYYYDKTYSKACLIAVGEVNPSLLDLKHLNYLDLSWNNFSGIAIPNFFGLFPELTYLNLSTALFGGTIPHHLGNLSALHSLSLGTDYLLSYYYGKIPSLVVNTLHWTSSLYSLQILDMSGIDLSNVPLDSFQTITSFPSLLNLNLSDCSLQFNSLRLSSIENLTSLTILDLSYNLIQGPIPSAIRNMTSLKILQLSNNQFSSNYSILDELKYLNKLEVLDLSTNMLAGKMNESRFPNFSSPFIGDNLLELDLSNNKLTGYLPNWLHQLRSPNIINLSGNLFEGEILTSFGAFQSLKKLYLSYNKLSGRIPTSFGALESLKELRLDDNQLSGPIPTSLTKLSALETLILLDNFLSGQIPTSLGRMSALTKLYLSRNQFVGEIPVSLRKLSNLKVLDLADNQFNGSIPVSLGQLSQLTYLNLASNQFQGVVSELHFARLSKLKQLSLQNNSLSIKIRSGWVPPFQLKLLVLSSCDVGPQVPSWLQTQTELESLLISKTGILDSIPNWFQNFTLLDTLDLSDNQIYGKVPNFPKLLDLYLSSNQFEGSLPVFPSSLQVLDLSNNKFIGPIRPDFCYSLLHLKALFLSNNSLNGTIPSSLCKMLSLSKLDFSKNDLSGVVPDCPGGLTGLELIDLTSNKLSGTFQWSESRSLKSLRLSENHFHGEIFAILQNCTELRILDVSNNNFSEEIPTWIGENLPYLRILKLSSNKYNGSLSANLCHLNSIKVLDVAGNKLSGNIPNCFGNFSAMLFNQTDIGGLFDYGSSYEDKLSQVIKGREYEYTKNLRFVTNLDLSNNNFVGKIPEQLANLSGLLGLNLSRNHLTGSIPMKIGQMRSLESLDLSNNHLSGTIPQSISAVTTLSYLNLSNNNLSGPIPSGNQLHTFNDTSYNGNSELCGLPLERKCTYVDRKEKEKREEDGDGFITMWFYIGVACGCAVGFWGFCGVLLFKKSWRYAYFQFVSDIVDQLFYRIARRKVQQRRN